MSGVVQQQGATGLATRAGGDRGAVLAVLDGPSQLDPAEAQAVLAYAQMVSVVDGRPLRVLLVRPRLGFTTDAPVVAARRHRRRQVMRWLSTRSQTHVEVEELSVPRRVAQHPAQLWDRVLAAASVRGATCVVVSEQMPITSGDGRVTPAHTDATAPSSAPTVITVLARSSAHRSQDYRRWT